MAEQENLTPEQVANWRTALIGMFGTYALMMPVEQIQKMRDELQEWCDKEAGENNGSGG